MTSKGELRETAIGTKPPFSAESHLYTSSTTESEPLNAAGKSALYRFRHFAANPPAFLPRPFMKLWYAFMLLKPGEAGLAFAVIHFPLYFPLCRQNPVVFRPVTEQNRVAANAPAALGVFRNRPYCFFLAFPLYFRELFYRMIRSEGLERLQVFALSFSWRESLGFSVFTITIIPDFPARAVPVLRPAAPSCGGG